MAVVVVFDGVYWDERWGELDGLKGLEEGENGELGRRQEKGKSWSLFHQAISAQKWTALPGHLGLLATSLVPTVLCSTYLLQPWSTRYLSL